MHRSYKSGKIRAVLFEAVTLNNVPRPNLSCLLGSLIWFREEPFPVTADIWQLFYCFPVLEENRDELHSVQWTK